MSLLFSTGFIYIRTLLQPLGTTAALLFLRTFSSLHKYLKIGPNATLVAAFSYVNFNALYIGNYIHMYFHHFKANIRLLCLFWRLFNFALFVII